MAPNWLFYLAVISLVLAFVTAIIIISDVIRHPQKMAVMNWVWPITALYFGPLGLWMYLVARRDFGDAHSGHNPSKIVQLSKALRGARTRTSNLRIWLCLGRRALTQVQTA
jgi:hypothetical protein